MNRSAKESHKRISDSRNFGLYLHLITFALNGTPKESPRANTEWPNLSHYNFRFRNKQTISAQNKLAYCNSAIIRIISRKLFRSPPISHIYCCSLWQAAFSDMDSRVPRGHVPLAFFIKCIISWKQGSGNFEICSSSRWRRWRLRHQWAHFQ